jgi:hypothetical protein
MMSKELLKALVDILNDLKLRKNLNEDALNISDSVLARAEKAVESYLAQPEQTEQEPELNQKSFRGLELSGDSYPPEYIEESPRYDMSIHDNPGALAWTRFFMETYPACNVDDQTMFGWFANAMMAMHDHTCRNTAPPTREPLSEDEIAQTTKDMSEFAADMFKAGIRAAEKAHGIGVDDV